MSKAIKKYIIPIEFLDNVLYFDAIKNFNDSNFKYLKKSNVKYASHEINFNLIDKCNEPESNLLKLIYEIHNKAKNNKLLYGVPYFYQGSKFSRIKLSEWEEYGIENLKLDTHDLLITNNGLPTSGGELIDVGQGLMFVDNSSRVIYDCGGTTPYKNIKKYLDKTSPYKVVISHWHTDHYKYLFDILNDFSIEEVIVPGTTLKTGTSIKLKEIISKDGKMSFHTKRNVGAYKMIKSPSRGKLVSNSNSCILINNDWVLTGDQTTNFINKMIGAIDTINFQVPHHGSGAKAHDPSKLNIKRIDNFYVSVNLPSGYKKMPDWHFVKKYRKSIT